MYGAIEFYQACRAEGIQPIIGCEIYICPNRFEKHGAAREYSHLVLLCENFTGYQNLMQLVSLGFTEGFYYRPRIDYKLLREHAEGLICLSGCLSGDLPKMLLQGRMQDAKDYVYEMQSIFGKDRFYIEIMDHGLPDEKMALNRLKQLSRETGVPLAATNDCHYLYREDAQAQEVLMCIQTGKTLQDETRMRMETEEMYAFSFRTARRRWTTRRKLRKGAAWNLISASSICRIFPLRPAKQLWKCSPVFVWTACASVIRIRRRIPPASPEPALITSFP